MQNLPKQLSKLYRQIWQISHEFCAGSKIYIYMHCYIYVHIMYWYGTFHYLSIVLIPLSVQQSSEDFGVCFGLPYALLQLGTDLVGEGESRGNLDLIDLKWNYHLVEILDDVKDVFKIRFDVETLYHR